MASKINKVPILRWLCEKKERGSELSFIFRVYLPANGACGKKMSNKEVPFPFLAALTAKPCTQRAFFWRTTLTKTAEHNISPPSNKRNCSEKEGRGQAHIKSSKKIPPLPKTPTKPVPLRTGRAGRPVWLIYQLLLKLPVAESAEKGRVRGVSERAGISPPRCLTTWFMVELLRKIGGLGGLKWRKIKTESTEHVWKAKDPLLLEQWLV